MKAKMVHECIHILDLDKSLGFCEKALGLTVQRRMGPEDSSWENVFIDNEETDFQMELTWNKSRTEPYNNEGRKTHLAFEVDDMDAFHSLHEEMSCICFVNKKMGIYFIKDPDGYWLEIVPTKQLLIEEDYIKASYLGNTPCNSPSCQAKNALLLLVGSYLRSRSNIHTSTSKLETLTRAR